jgi:hypothetical protein
VICLICSVTICRRATKIASFSATETVTNAYNFLDIEVGRTMAQDLFIGAFNTGVHVDHTLDRITLRNLLNQVFWDVLRVFRLGFLQDLECQGRCRSNSRSPGGRPPPESEPPRQRAV